MRYIKYFAVILLAVYCVSALVQIASQRDVFQWDFQLYYTAAKDLVSGNNPYAQGNYVVQGNYFPCCYLPFALYFFGLFTFFDYKIAYYIYLLFQVLLIIAIVLLWKKKFLDKEPGLIFYILCILAFNGTIYLSLRSGNICLFEQLLIWLALYCFIKRKYGYFVLGITLAAQFKLVPVVFLLLLLTAEVDNKVKYLLRAFVPFTATILTQYLIMPSYFKGFINNVSMLKAEGGIMTPSNMSLIREIFKPANNPFPTMNVENFHLIVYIAVVSIVLFTGYQAFKKINDLEMPGKERWYIYLSIIIYVLISMRFKDYSYVILIIPAYFILDKIANLKSSFFLIFVLMLSSKHVTLPYFEDIFEILWSYYPLFLAYLLYVIYVKTIFSLDKNSHSQLTK